MRDLVAQARPDLLAAVREVVGRDPFGAVDEGTAYQQPAIFCASLARLEALGHGERPDCYAGHSLGEITALVAAGALSEHDGLRLVTLRGRLMQQVDERARGAMVAIGTSAAAARALAEAHGVTLAIDNAPRQSVLSGDAAAIGRAQEAARAQGLKTVLLPIRVAAHTPALASIAGQLRALLDEIDVRAPRRPCFSCVTAREFDDVRARLAQSLTRPVRWREVLLALHARGVRRFVEIGPGRALGGLVRATLADAEVVSSRPLVAADA
jgi:[acyl-carrier-protein] S-malonyltransferase